MDYPSRLMFGYKGPVIIYRLGGRRILGGITGFLGEQKGGSVVTLNPKTLEEFTDGTTQICLENEGIGGGGGRESQRKLLGGITSVK